MRKHYYEEPDGLLYWNGHYSLFLGGIMNISLLTRRKIRYYELENYFGLVVISYGIR